MRALEAGLAVALVAALPGCGGSSAPTSPSGGRAGTTGSTATPTPEPTPTPADTANQAPSLAFNVAPRQGLAPLEVKINMCPTQDAEGDPLEFSFDFAGGARGACSDGSDASCRQCATYRDAGTFDVSGCVTDGAPGREPVCDSARVTVTKAVVIAARLQVQTMCVLVGSGEITRLRAASVHAESVRMILRKGGDRDTRDVDIQDDRASFTWNPAPFGDGDYTLEVQLRNGSDVLSRGDHAAKLDQGC